MLWNKYRSLEDKVKRSRHKAAWVGILVICGIASVMVLGAFSFLSLQVMTPVHRWCIS